MFKFVKDFPTFKLGIRELMEISYSVNQALDGVNVSIDLPHIGDEDYIVETNVVTQLARNATFRPTGNGVGWSAGPEVQISPYGTTYRTSGGLLFGWKANLTGEHGAQEGWEFFVSHAKYADEGFPPESTLATAAREYGWKYTDDSGCYVPMPYEEFVSYYGRGNGAKEEVI